jgi:hypothetical protein
MSINQNSVINYSAFNKDFKNTFLNNKPFPFIVLDNFLNINFFNDVTNSISNNTTQLNKKFNTSLEKKSISLNSQIPSLVKDLVAELSSDKWVAFIKELTGMQDIFPADIDNTKLANFHVMTGGGYLGPHVDHSQDPKTNLPHVLNIIVYLSKAWRDDFKGATLFFDKYGKKVINKANYKPNRAVIFLHTPYTFHGVERIPENIKSERAIVYLDYYSKSLDPYKHINLDFKNHWFKHGTTFVFDKFIDYLKFKNIPYLKSYLRYKISKLISIN